MLGYRVIVKRLVTASIALIIALTTSIGILADIDNNNGGGTGGGNSSYP